MAMTDTQKEQFFGAIDELVGDPDIQELVKTIESSPELCQGHYDRYMAILSEFNGAKRYAMAGAMMKLGASRIGVKGALEVLA